MGRMDRVNHQVKREVGMILQQEIQDPRIAFVTVTDVVVSPDLRMARVSYSVLGEDKQREAAGLALGKAKGLIRKLLGQRISMRYTPDLEFIFDTSIEYSARIEQALEEIHQQQNKKDEDHESTEDSA